jgi:hypothetical protein
MPSRGRSACAQAFHFHFGRRFGDWTVVLINGFTPPQSSADFSPANVPGANSNQVVGINIGANVGFAIVNAASNIRYLERWPTRLNRGGIERSRCCGGAGGGRMV